MRNAINHQMRLNVPRVLDVQLDLNGRHELVPILYALQHVYGNPELRDAILALISQDVNEHSRADRGRQGMDYWHILVLAGVRLGCDLDFDALQDLAHNHLSLRGIMDIGGWDEHANEFGWRRIRDNVCLLQSSTIQQIINLIVLAGHKIVPDAVMRVRADSSVFETQIHYPTESSLICDGVIKILELCRALADVHGVLGWRQSKHWEKTVRSEAREVGRIAAKKGPNYQRRLCDAYRSLFRTSQLIISRARKLCVVTGMKEPVPADLFGPNSLQAFIVRTERVHDTATRRILNGETVENDEKLFSIFEPHTQLYKRGKAGEPIQFGRLVLLYEDGAGFIVHHHVMPRDAGDRDVIVEQTRKLQDRLGGKIEEFSLDRGFHSPVNQEELSKIIPELCLPKPGAKQSAKQSKEANDTFRASQRRHSGVESLIGALQSGNGQKRCRDRTEVGFERYVALGVLGRNLHTLGRILIQQRSPKSEAARSYRGAA